MIVSLDFFGGCFSPANSVWLLLFRTGVLQAYFIADGAFKVPPRDVIASCLHARCTPYGKFPKQFILTVLFTLHFNICLLLQGEINAQTGAFVA